MTPSEFKAWFTGYVENIDGKPSDKQWTRIKARVTEIDGVTTPRQVFVDRYWHWPLAYPQYPFNGICTNAVSSVVANNSSGAAVLNLGGQHAVAESVSCFNVTDGFTALGQLDARMDN
jgi:hypothetical protein